MGIVSFAHLKKVAGIKEPATFLDGKQPEQAKKELEEKDVFRFTEKSRLIADDFTECFCLGCVSATVEAPESGRDIWWCKREDPDSEYQTVFKVIKPEYTVAMCPMFKKGKEHQSVEVEEKTVSVV